MNGKGIIIAIVSLGVGLGGLILNGQRSTNRAIDNFGPKSIKTFPTFAKTSLTSARGWLG